MKVPVEHSYRADSGLPEYDRNLWLLPPPKVSHAFSTGDGISCLVQTGHSGIPTRQTQEVKAEINTFALIFMPDGWPDHEAHVGARIRRGGPGFQVFAKAPGTPVRWITRPTAARAVHLHIPPTMLKSFFADRNIGEPEPLTGFVATDQRLLALGAQYVRDVMGGAATDSLVIESYAALLWPYLFAVRKEFPSRGGLSGRVLRRLTDYAMANLGSEVSLSELAAIADLSPYHFCRAFKQSTGLPPHAWLTARRIARAQEMMLAHREMGLTEIALGVGYSTQAAFGVAFRRVTGVTPGQWRRERAG